MYASDAKGTELVKNRTRHTFSCRYAVIVKQLLYKSFLECVLRVIYTNILHITDPCSCYNIPLIFLTSTKTKIQSVIYVVQNFKSYSANILSCCKLNIIYIIKTQSHKQSYGLPPKSK